MHGDRNTLVLGPGFGDDGDGRRHERGDRGKQLGRRLLHPVETREAHARHVEERIRFLGATSRDHRHLAERPHERREDLACPLDGPSSMRAVDDLGQRAVEIEKDARCGGASAERCEVRP